MVISDRFWRSVRVVFEDFWHTLITLTFDYLISRNLLSRILHTSTGLVSTQADNWLAGYILAMTLVLSKFGLQLGEFLISKQVGVKLGSLNCWFQLISICIYLLLHFWWQKQEGYSQRFSCCWYIHWGLLKLAISLQIVTQKNNYLDLTFVIIGWL